MPRPDGPDRVNHSSAHKSLRALENDIRDWLTTANNNPKPFIWTKTADETLDSLSNYCHKLSTRTDNSGH